MNSQNKAFTYLFTAVAIGAVIMVSFYYVKGRMRTTEHDLDLSQKVEAPASEKGEFIGIYSAGTPLEADGKRIAFFTVNRKEDGGYLGSAKLDTVGGEDSTYFQCIDVRIAEKEFFLKCAHESEGSLSLNGQWQKGESGLEVSGQVLWAKSGNAVLDTSARFFFSASE